MKKHLLILIALYISFCVTAQIPNAGFESWEVIAGRYSEPTEYDTNNDESVGFEMVKEVAGRSGGSAMEVISHWDATYMYEFGGLATSSFPYTGRPTSFQGYFKSTMKANDTAIIAVGFTYLGNAIGAGVKYVTGDAASFTFFDVPINYSSGATPDSASIVVLNGSLTPRFSSTMVADNSVIVDDLSFNTGTAVASVSSNTINIFSNPFSGKLYVNVPLTQGVVLTIYNMLGESVHRSILHASFTELNLSGFRTGIYLVQVEQGGQKTVKKIVVQ